MRLRTDASNYGIIQFLLAFCGLTALMIMLYQLGLNGWGMLFAIGLYLAALIVSFRVITDLNGTFDLALSSLEYDPTFKGNYLAYITPQESSYRDFIENMAVLRMLFVGEIRSETRFSDDHHQVLISDDMFYDEWRQTVKVLQLADKTHRLALQLGDLTIVGDLNRKSLRPVLECLMIAKKQRQALIDESGQDEQLREGINLMLEEVVVAIKDGQRIFDLHASRHTAHLTAEAEMLKLSRRGTSYDWDKAFEEAEAQSEAKTPLRLLETAPSDNTQAN